MFRKILFRNLIFMMIPILVIEVFILFSAMQLSILDDYKCYNLTEIKSAPLFYLEQRLNVSVALPENLKDAGFDHVRNGKKAGSYYYQYNNSSIHLYILSEETVSKLKAGENPGTIYVRLIEDSATARYVENEYSKEIGMDDTMLSNYVDNIIFSEIDYPAMKILILSYVKFICIFLIGFTLLYSVLAMIYPSLNFSFKNKGMFKSRMDLIEILDKELESSDVERKGNTYITDNYTIKAYISRIDISKNETLVPGTNVSK